MIEGTITLARVVDVISNIASDEPNISTIILNDVYKLNSLPEAKYPVFALTQNTHTEDEEFMYFNFNLFYIERLTNDDYQNEIDNQSIGIEVLRNIIRKTAEYLGADVINTISYYPFEQRFSDMTSGVYANVEFSVPLSNCYEDYSF